MATDSAVSNSDVFKAPPPVGQKSGHSSSGLTEMTPGAVLSLLWNGRSSAVLMWLQTDNQFLTSC